MKTSLTASILLGALALAGCATQPLPSGAPVASTASVGEYHLAAGDKVRVTTFNEPTLSGELVVGSNGSIAMPLVGDIPARGLTVTDLQAAIAQRLETGGFVRSPSVAAEVIEFRPFYILGEVQKPGEYPYSVGLTVTKAVATAGGFTYRANAKQVFITRDGSTTEQSVPVTASTPIGPGDTIRVGERFF